MSIKNSLPKLKYSTTIQDALDNKVASITTSIDAGNESTFREIRGSKGIDKVLKSIGRYSKNSPELVTIKYIFTLDNYDIENISQFVEKIKVNNLIVCNYLISADFKYGELTEKVVLSIISLYFRLYFEGIYTVSFDEHVFHRVRSIRENVYDHITTLNNNSNKDNVIEKMMDNLRKRSSNTVVIWGTGEFSKYLLRTMDITRENNRLTISGVVDGMEKKWGTNFMGYKVENPSSLINNEVNIVIASANYYGEILNKIISLGVSRDRVIPNFLL